MTTPQLEIVQKLYEKTRAREAAWETTSIDHQFTLKMRSGTVVVDHYPKEGSYQLLVLNKQGASVAVLSAKRTDGYYQLFVSLWNEIVESFYRIEETLRNVLNELNTSGEVGGDDLPF